MTTENTKNTENKPFKMHIHTIDITDSISLDGVKTEDAERINNSVIKELNKIRDIAINIHQDLFERGLFIKRPTRHLCFIMQTSVAMWELTSLVFKGFKDKFKIGDMTEEELTQEFFLSNPEYKEFLEKANAKYQDQVELPSLEKEELSDLSSLGESFLTPLGKVITKDIGLITELAIKLQGQLFEHERVIFENLTTHLKFLLKQSVLAWENSVKEQVQEMKDSESTDSENALDN